MPTVRQAILILSVLLHTGAAGAQSATTPRLLLACAPCHGFDGVGHDRTIPNLAGQHRDYLYGQLLAFRTAQRMHPAMSFFSVQMTREELEAIVEYYSSLPPP